MKMLQRRRMRNNLLLVLGWFILMPFHAKAEMQSSIKICINKAASNSEVALFAANELFRGLRTLTGPSIHLEFGTYEQKQGCICLVLSEPPSAQTSAESFEFSTDSQGVLCIKADAPVGVLWGVRDFIHYYAKDWLTAFNRNQPFRLDYSAAPALQTRGLWSWWHGTWDPYTYIDRASEWKLNTVCFWTRGTPLDAERLVKYAHERGVKIWWGFGWGWNEGDFADASPQLAQRLMKLHEMQKARIGAKPASLCPSDPQTSQAMMDFVLDVFEHQYAWLPRIDGIYFQTATEAVCPCSQCKAKPLGKALLPVILPILKEMHRRYPPLQISWGVHNRKDIREFEALKQVPSYVNLCWEDGLTWADDQQLAQEQMTYRGSTENYAGVYRIAMNCGLNLRDVEIRNDPARHWLPRIETLWNYLEDGRPANVGQNYRVLKLGNQEIGSACTSNWRPQVVQTIIENRNFTHLRDWSRTLAQGPAQQKGLFLLVEAGMIDLKMRRMPAMAAELIWNPLAEDKELLRRCNLIWSKQTGGWSEPANPFWNETLKVTADKTQPTVLNVTEN